MEDVRIPLLRGDVMRARDELVAGRARIAELELQMAAAASDLAMARNTVHELREECALLRDSSQLLSQRVTELQAIRADDRRALEANDVAIVTLRNDLGTIASHLADQADLRGWEEEFDTFVTRVNILTSEEWLYRISPTTTFAYNVVVTARIRRDDRERVAGAIENHLENVFDIIEADNTHGTVSVRRDQERST